MSLNTFILLSPEDQASSTRKHGTFIAVNNLGPVKVLLYHLDDFYVEMYYNCQKGQVEQVKTFDSLELLEPYLAAIDLSDLFPPEKSANSQPAPSTGFGAQVWKKLCKLFPLMVATSSCTLALCDKFPLHL